MAVPRPADVGGDRGELDSGVLQDLVQALRLPGALLDLSLAVPGEVAELTERLRREERRVDQQVFDEMAHPGGVGHLGLAPRDVAQVPGVAHVTLEGVLHDLKDRDWLSVLLRR
jgi:hypothetical protein